MTRNLISGLDPTDEALFAFICRCRLESEIELIDMGFVSAYAGEHKIDEDELRTALKVFVNKGFIKQPPARGGLLPVSLQLTSAGLLTYVNAYERERFKIARDETVVAIHEKGANDMNELLSVVGEKSRGLLSLVIERLAAAGDLMVTQSFGGPESWMATPSLKRQVRETKQDREAGTAP